MPARLVLTWMRLVRAGHTRRQRQRNPAWRAAREQWRRQRYYSNLPHTRVLETADRDARADERPQLRVEWLQQEQQKKQRQAEQREQRRQATATGCSLACVSLALRGLRCAHELRQRAGDGQHGRPSPPTSARQQREHGGGFSADRDSVDSAAAEHAPRALGVVASSASASRHGRGAGATAAAGSNAAGPHGAEELCGPCGEDPADVTDDGSDGADTAASSDAGDDARRVLAGGPAGREKDSPRRTRRHDGALDLRPRARCALRLWLDGGGGGQTRLLHALRARGDG